MTNVLLIIHLLVCIAMVGLILLQRSEGGALGIGGGPGGMMSNRSSANLLTRTTSVLAAVFFLTSFIFAVLASDGESSVTDQLGNDAGADTTSDETLPDLTGFGTQDPVDTTSSTPVDDTVAPGSADDTPTTDDPQ